MQKLFQIGGLVASAVLIVFGATAIFMGLDGRSTVRDSLRQEQIVFGALLPTTRQSQSTPPSGPTSKSPRAPRHEPLQSYPRARARGFRRPDLRAARGATSPLADPDNPAGGSEARREPSRTRRASRKRTGLETPGSQRRPCPRR